VNDLTSKLKRSRLKCEIKFDLYYKLTTNKNQTNLKFGFLWFSEVFKNHKTVFSSKCSVFEQGVCTEKVA